MAAELKLIQAVELKFALTSTDASLERVASIYLCPLLLKLATPYQSNRKKVEEVLAMLDNRIRGNASVKLPFEPLLAQYKDPTVSEVVKTRTIQYLCSALGDRSCSSALLQQLVNGFAKYPVMQKPIVFYMIGSMLATFPSPESTQEEKAICLAYQISREEDATSLAKCLIDLMFLNPAQLNPQRAANRNAVQSVPTPLLQGEIEFLTPLGSSTYTATSLTAVKLGILRFASISILKDAFRFEIGLVASFDLKHDLQMQANTVMRRCNPATSEQIYVDELFNLLLNRSLEARFAIRVYQLLSKSTLATREADKAQRCITQGVEYPILSTC
ncbi:putative Proteasome component [Taphrina deformans PYCC 5710]|uniref:Proteasome component n=1 Tax=Taphrina deformans (strain PYCC 5710 / ATCC 11124 / CBS 356.35 / IMI 108563 / JCM 9778 / NBRC 8474) TaxID=1097556 RepID=R4XDH5_TAPDE|nr:putative Proteasome component [Taphrina deformans PYCC 5710]|eukprot:CCG82463.1 putative Proteasome component [Taphrina deformans PYCC 5710]